MPKINQPKIFLQHEEVTKGKLVKLSDDKFEGKHPNGIVEGYERNGYFSELPKVNYSFYIGGLKTSEITDIIESTDNSVKFKTLNSTYLLTF